MAVQKSADFELAYVVDENALRRLDAILQSVNEVRGYDVTTKDGFTYGPEDLDKVLSLSNSTDRAIIGLVAYTGSSPDEPSLVVHLKGGALTSVFYQIKAEQAEVADLDDQMKEWVGEIRAWYSSIAMWGINKELALACAIWFVLLLAILQIPSIRGQNASTQATVGAYIFVVAIIVVSLFGRVRKVLFPKAAFAIGYGVKRHQSLEQRRHVALVGILLAFVVSVASSIAASYLIGS